VPALVGVAQGFTWTHGFLAATGWIDWLAALPVEQRLVFPNPDWLIAKFADPCSPAEAVARPIPTR
jgi:hypothetical protein